MRVFAQQNDTVDAIVWRNLGTTLGYVEQTLELNPHIATMGPVLPLGTAIDLPDLQLANPGQQNTVHLWD